MCYFCIGFCYVIEIVVEMVFVEFFIGFEILQLVIVWVDFICQDYVLYVVFEEVVEFKFEVDQFDVNSGKQIVYEVVDVQRYGDDFVYFMWLGLVECGDMFFCD